MSDDVIRGILMEKKRRARACRRVAENVVIVAMFAILGFSVVFAVAAS